LEDDCAVAAAGQPIVRLIEESAPQLRVGLAPSLAQSLSPGDKTEVLLGDEIFAATVDRLLPDLDPASRLRDVLLTLEVGPAEAVGLYGRTGTVSLQSNVQERGAWLPLDAVRAAAAGTWTVLTLNEEAEGQGTIALEAVEIIHTDGDRVFVRGTFRDGAAIVSSGVHRVVPGQSAVDLSHPGADALLISQAEGA